MTERPGGSDIGQSETQAELFDEATNTWSISGFKWFSSATTANLTMLLARTIDPKEGTVRTGSKGLSLYIAEMRQPDGQLNGVRVHRLKDKYGTKGLPTAELQLSGMKANMVYIILLFFFYLSNFLFRSEILVEVYLVLHLFLTLLEFTLVLVLYVLFVDL